MSYEDLSGGISEHEAGEEFMQKEDERREDEQQAAAEASLRKALMRSGALKVCGYIADSQSSLEASKITPDRDAVEDALDVLGLHEVLRLVGKWAQEQQKAKGSAA